jgi:hypothetical protein
MTKKLTLISHFYNEEYLLPFWLEYHKKIFDHGILINYISTDRSVEIINRICPTWEIIQTKNINPDGTPLFQAEYVDIEVNEVEESIKHGFKIALNITEFLILENSISDFKAELDDNFIYMLIPYSVMSDNKNLELKNYNDFFNNITYVYDIFNERLNRMLHSEKKLQYKPGRHQFIGSENKIKKFDNKFFIMWCGFYPFNKEFIKRKLQIQNNIPQSDKDAGFGFQHIINYEKLIDKFQENLIYSSNNNNLEKLNIIKNIK